MSYNGSGTFLINTAGQPVVSGTVISSTAFNALTADLATGLSTAITKDGQTTPTANIPMGNNKITGLAAGTAATDAANLSQVQSTTAKLINSVSGADTITGTLSPTLTAYAAGQMFYFVAAGDNTGAVTLNINSLGAKSVTRDGAVALAAGDIKSGEVVVVVYDGTQFQVVSQVNSGGDATFANVSITSALNVGGVATFTGNPVLSGGTANGVLYLNGSKVATSGSALTFDGTNLGIGTSSPGYKLDVAGNASFTSGVSTTSVFVGSAAGNGGATVRFLGSSTTKNWLIGSQFNASGALEFTQSTTNGGSTFTTPSMLLDASGNLGLGVTPSAWQSTRRVVQVGANGGALWGINSGAGTCFLSNNTYYDGTNYKYINTANATYYAQASDGKHEWYVAASGTAGNNITSFTQAMTLNASGDLLLQAAAPNFYIQPSTTTSNALTRCINTGGTLYVGLDSSAGGLGGAYTANFWHSGNYAMVFATNNVERARITAAGELVIGSTTVAAGERLRVTGSGTTSATYNCYFQNSAGSRVFSFEDAGKFTTGTLADSPYNLVVGATNRDLFVDNAGAIGYVSSVRASKTNITPVSDTDWLLQLNPVTFNFRKKDADGNYTDEADGPVKHGLIAEEVEAVNADLCFYDDEDKGGALRGVNYSHLITPMLKLIQKQQAAIAALEAKVAALEVK